MGVRRIMPIERARLAELCRAVAGARPYLAEPDGMDDWQTPPSAATATFLIPSGLITGPTGSTPTARTSSSGRLTSRGSRRDRTRVKRAGLQHGDLLVGGG